MEDFIFCYSSIESSKEWLHETLTSFEIEVHDLHPEEEGNEGGFGHPMKICGTSSESNSDKTSIGEDQVFTSDKEIFVVSRHLLWSDEVVEQFSRFDLIIGGFLTPEKLIGLWGLS